MLVLPVGAWAPVEDAVTPGDGWAATLQLELLRHHSCSARLTAGFEQGVGDTRVIGDTL